MNVNFSWLYQYEYPNLYFPNCSFQKEKGFSSPFVFFNHLIEHNSSTNRDTAPIISNLRNAHEVSREFASVTDVDCELLITNYRLIFFKMLSPSERSEVSGNQASSDYAIYSTQDVDALTPSPRKNSTPRILFTLPLSYIRLWKRDNEVFTIENTADKTQIKFMAALNKTLNSGTNKIGYTFGNNTNNTVTLNDMQKASAKLQNTSSFASLKYQKLSINQLAALNNYLSIPSYLNPTLADYNDIKGIAGNLFSIVEIDLIIPMKVKLGFKLFPKIQPAKKEEATFINAISSNVTLGYSPYLFSGDFIIICRNNVFSKYAYSALEKQSTVNDALVIMDDLLNMTLRGEPLSLLSAPILKLLVDKINTQATGIGNYNGGFDVNSGSTSGEKEGLSARIHDPLASPTTAAAIVTKTPSVGERDNLGDSSKQTMATAEISWDKFTYKFPSEILNLIVTLNPTKKLNITVSNIVETFNLSEFNAPSSVLYSNSPLAGVGISEINKSIPISSVGQIGQQQSPQLLMMGKSIMPQMNIMNPFSDGSQNRIQVPGGGIGPTMNSPFMAGANNAVVANNSNRFSSEFDNVDMMTDILPYQQLSKYKLTSLFTNSANCQIIKNIPALKNKFFLPYCFTNNELNSNMPFETKFVGDNINMYNLIMPLNKQYVIPPKGIYDLLLAPPLNYLHMVTRQPLAQYPLCNTMPIVNVYPVIPSLQNYLPQFSKIFKDGRAPFVSLIEVSMQKRYAHVLFRSGPIDTNVIGNLKKYETTIIPAFCQLPGTKTVFYLGNRESGCAFPQPPKEYTDKIDIIEAMCPTPGDISDIYNQLCDTVSTTSNQYHAYNSTGRLEKPSENILFAASQQSSTADFNFKQQKKLSDCAFNALTHPYKLNVRSQEQPDSIISCKASWHSIAQHFVTVAKAISDTLTYGETESLPVDTQLTPAIMQIQNSGILNNVFLSGEYEALFGGLLCILVEMILPSKNGYNRTIDGLMDLITKHILQPGFVNVSRYYILHSGASTLRENDGKRNFWILPLIFECINLLINCSTENIRSFSYKPELLDYLYFMLLSDMYGDLIAVNDIERLCSKVMMVTHSLVNSSAKRRDMKVAYELKQNILENTKRTLDVERLFDGQTWFTESVQNYCKTF